MKRQFLAVLVAATLALAASSVFAVEQTMVFSGDGDAGGDCYETTIWTREIYTGRDMGSDSSSSNYGSGPHWGANELPGTGGDPAEANKNTRGLIRFDVSDLAGQFASITSVTLRMYQYERNGGWEPEVDVSAWRVSDVNSNWQEGFDTGSQSWPGWWNRTCWSQKLQGLGDAGWVGNGWSGGLGAPGGAGYDIPALGSVTSTGFDTWLDIPLGGDLDAMMTAWATSPVVETVTGKFADPEEFTTVANEGLLITAESLITWRSSEYDDVGGGGTADQWCPQLVVVYDDGLGAWPVGDFDHDMDVDDADIDMLCDFIRLGLPYDAEYDISANGTSGGSDAVVDMLDLDYHVRSLVYTTVGEGTEYGDFNLDGVIDTTDLTRLATNYGDDDWMWDDGNANRNIDTNIDNTDLTILATYYGFVAPDMVPEPMTLSLLAVGGAVLLRRRK